MAVGGSSPPPPLEDGTSRPPLLPKSPCPTNPKMPFSFSDVVKGHRSTQVGADSTLSASFADKVKGQNWIPEPSTVPLKPVSIYQGKPSVVFSLAEKSDLIAHMNFVLIGKFSHGRPPLNVIQGFFVGLKLQGTFNLSLLDSKHLVIECVHKADFVRIWLRLVWSIHGFKMRVFKWDDAFNPFKESPIAPVWIRIEGLPIYMFEAKTLMSLANSIGSPLKVDPTNLARSNLASARVCVELDVSKPLVDAIWVQFVDEKSKQVSDGFWANVYYDVVPLFRSACFHLGHSVAGCKRGSNGSLSMVQMNDSQLFDNLPKPNSDSAQVVYDKVLQNTSVATKEVLDTTDSKTLQRTNNSCRQITLGLHYQQGTTSFQGSAASRKLSASESKMVSNVVNMSEVHHSTVDNSLQGANASTVQVDVQKTIQQVLAAVDPVLQGPPDVHIGVQNSFGILNSEGLDYDSNLQKLEGVDVAAALKRQTACVGNKVVNVAECAAVQTETGVAVFPGDHAARIPVQSQGSKAQELEIQVNSYSCRQATTDGVTARSIAAQQQHSGQNSSCNSEAQPSILSTSCHSSTRSTQHHSWADLVEEDDIKAISKLKLEDAADSVVDLQHLQGTVCFADFERDKQVQCHVVKGDVHTTQAEHGTRMVSQVSLDVLIAQGDAATVDQGTRQFVQEGLVKQGQVQQVDSEADLEVIEGEQEQQQPGQFRLAVGEQQTVGNSAGILSTVGGTSKEALGCKTPDMMKTSSKAFDTNLPIDFDSEENVLSGMESNGEQAAAIKDIKLNGVI